MLLRFELKYKKRNWPSQWTHFVYRASQISGGPRHATHPVNAILNYAYSVAAAQITRALIASGFDSTAGFLHADSNGRHSLIVTDPPGAAAWPISASSFIIMPAVVKDAGAAKEALRFFAWAYAHGDEAAEELGYVPMPPNVKNLVIMQLWTEIKGPGGDPVYRPN
jgi:hypothetical protein